MSNIVISPESGILEFNNNSPSGAAIGSATAPIRLDATGGNSFITGANFGIGTNSPSQTLHVKGIGMIEDTSSTAYGTLQFGTDTSRYIRGNSAELQVGSTIQQLHFQNTSAVGQIASSAGNGTDAIQILARTVHTSANILEVVNGNGADPIFIVDYTGNVGIGVTPVYDLTIGGNAVGSTRGLRINDPSNAIFGAHFSFADTPNEVHIGGITADVYNDAIGINREATRTITIDSSEQVGIGTSEPRNDLSVFNDTDSPTVSIHAMNNNETGAVLRLIEGTNHQGAFLRYDASANTFNIGVHDTSDTTFANDTNVISILRSNGRVGIGTTNPSSPLEVINDSSDDGIMLKDDGFGLVTLIGSDGSHNARTRFYNGSHALVAEINANAGSSTYFNAGNVGIGTNSPTTELAVAGTISGVNGQFDQSLLISGVPVSTGSAAEADTLQTVTDRGSTTTTSISIGDDLAVDTDTLFVDASTDRVGINRSSLTTYDLEVRNGAGSNSSLGLIGGSASTFVLNNTDTSIVTVPAAQMFLRATGGFFFQSGTTTRAVLTKEGDFGIGTASPQSKLHLYEDGAGAPEFRISRSSNGQVWTQTIDSSARFLLQEAASEGGTLNTRLSIDDAGETLLAPNGGDVGIGTNSPSDKLHVEEDGGTVTIGSPTTSYGGIGFEDTALTAANSALFGLASSTILGVKAGGAIEMKIANNSSLGLLKMEQDKLYYTDGNFGIGTTSPQELLNVSGNIRIDDGKQLKLFSSNNTYNGFIEKSGTFGAISLGQQTEIITDIFLTRTDDGGVQIGESSLYSHGRNAIWPITSPKFAVYAGVTDDGGTGGAGFGFFNQGSAGKFLAMVPNITDANNGGFKLQTMSSSSVVEAMFFKSDGSVGIGTDSPDFRLEVVADDSAGVMAVRNGANARDTFRSENAAGTRTLSIGNDSNGHGLFLVRGAGGTSTSQIAGNGDTFFDTDTLYIDHSENKVGIGTDSPAELLHVDGNILIPQSKTLRGYYGGSIPVDIIGMSSTSDTIIYGGNNNSSDIFFDTHNGGVTGTKMTISNAGNVGIGITTPSEKLEVSGGNILLTGRKAGDDGPQIKLAGPFCTWQIENQYVNGATNDMFRIRNASLGSDALVIHRQNNRVGIGTTNPESPLEVINDTSSYDGITLKSSAGNLTARIGAGDSSNNARARFYNSSSQVAIQLHANSANPTYFNAGDVGIGTTNPDGILNTSGDHVLFQGLNKGYVRVRTARANTSDYAGVSSSILTLNNYYGNQEYGLFGTNNNNFRIQQSGNDGYLELDSNDFNLSGIRLVCDIVNQAPTNLAINLRDENADEVGFYSPATNVMGFVTDRTERMRIDDVGTIGMGTDSPSINGSKTTLHINSDTNGAAIRLSQSSNSSLIRYDNTNGLQVGTIASKNLSFETADTTAITIDTSQDVGIGTNSPEGKVHIYGGDSTEAFSNINGGLAIENDGSANHHFVFQTATAGGGKSFSITNAGNVGIGTDSPITGGSSLEVVGAIKGGVNVSDKSADFTLSSADNGNFINGTSTSFDQISITGDIGVNFNCTVIHPTKDVDIVASSSMIINGTTNGTVTLASGYQPASIVRIASNSYAVFGNLL